MLKEKLVTEDDIKEIQARVKVEIAECVKFAEESNFPDPSELYTDNYVQTDYPYIKD